MSRASTAWSSPRCAFLKRRRPAPATCMHSCTALHLRASNIEGGLPKPLCTAGPPQHQDLPSEAALALHKAIGRMAPRIMPWSQYAAAALHYGRDALAAVT